MSHRIRAAPRAPWPHRLGRPDDTAGPSETPPDQHSVRARRTRHLTACQSGLYALRIDLYPTARFHDLGSDHHATRINHTERKLRNHITQLAAMGYRVTLEPAA